MQPTSFIQRAKGEFTVMLAPGTPHCGPDQADHPIPGHFSYQIEIDWDDQALDEDGFLLDNTDFQIYFNSLASTGPISKSCEQLCKQAEEHFCDLIGVRGKDCQAIEVQIFAMPGVSVEYKCNPNKRQSDFTTKFMKFGDMVFPFVIGGAMAALSIALILWLFGRF